jgi:hypothetical protein
MSTLECRSASASLATAGNILFRASSTSSTPSSTKENEIQTLSLQHAIVPFLPSRPIVTTPLLQLIASAYNPLSHGDTHVVYATSSIGKTSACQAFIQKLLKKKPNSRGLMITCAVTEVYLTHMANVLGIDKEEDTLAVLVNGLRTIQPSPASVLILDELNVCGPDNCNIRLGSRVAHAVHLSTRYWNNFVRCDSE